MVRRIRRWAGYPSAGRKKSVSRERGKWTLCTIGYYGGTMRTKPLVRPPSRRLLLALGALVGPLAGAATWNGGGADATPFHEKGVPCLYFVTTNSYDHLHLPSDKVETLNPVLYEKVVRLAHLTALEIVNGDYQREVVIK